MKPTDFLVSFTWQPSKQSLTFDNSAGLQNDQAVAVIMKPSTLPIISADFWVFKTLCIQRENNPNFSRSVTSTGACISYLDTDLLCSKTVTSTLAY